MEYFESEPVHKQLNPFINGYMQTTWNNGQISSKDLLPRPGVSMIFNFKELRMHENRHLNKAIIGFHEQPLSLETPVDGADCFIIKLSPYGLSRFTETPQDRFTDRIVEGDFIFDSSINDLHELLYHTKNFSQRIKRVEAYLLEKLQIPTANDKVVFRLADILQENFESVSLGKLKEDLTLSPRQLERRFKALIGVNMQAFVRICRFDVAKSLLVDLSSSTLTKVGYKAGYYDQAHFSNEFKTLSNLSPKDFLSRSPFYQLLAKDKQSIPLT